MKTLKIITLGTALFVSTASYSGTVKFVSNSWDNICKVQISKGNNAPNGNIKTYTNVKKGASFSADFRMCYRRSANPNNCSSGYTGWTCSSNPGSATDIEDLD